MLSHIERNDSFASSRGNQSTRDLQRLRMTSNKSDGELTRMRINSNGISKMFLKNVSNRLKKVLLLLIRRLDEWAVSQNRVKLD